MSEQASVPASSNTPQNLQDKAAKAAICRELKQAITDLYKFTGVVDPPIIYSESHGSKFKASIYRLGSDKVEKIEQPVVDRCFQSALCDDEMAALEWLKKDMEARLNAAIGKSQKARVLPSTTLYYQHTPGVEWKPDLKPESQK